MDVHATVDEVLRLREAGATRVVIEGVEVEFSAAAPEAPKRKRRGAAFGETNLERRLFKPLGIRPPGDE